MEVNYEQLIKDCLKELVKDPDEVPEWLIGDMAVVSELVAQTRNIRYCELLTCCGHFYDQVFGNRVILVESERELLAGRTYATLATQIVLKYFKYNTLNSLRSCIFYYKVWGTNKTLIPSNYTRAPIGNGFRQRELFREY